MGAVIASDRLYAPFADGPERRSRHGLTFGGHPVAAAVALANLDVFAEEDLLRARARERGRRSGRCSTRCATSRSSATCAGPATSWRSSSCATKRDEGDVQPRTECDWLLRDFLSPRPVPPRADLPRRRPRRSGHPALAAADRRARRSSRRWRAPCGRRSRRRRAGSPCADPGRGMLPLRELVNGLDLHLVAGDEGLDRPVRWVHISELPDPTPWLSGGELLLTTGMQLADADEQRAYVERLAAHDLAGLGFGTGFRHPTVPAAISDAAAALGFPALRRALRGAVHRRHREGVHAPGERELRRAAARARRARAAGADRALGARAGRRGGGAGLADRRHRAGLRRPRRAARPLRRGSGAGARGPGGGGGRAAGAGALRRAPRLRARRRAPRPGAGRCPSRARPPAATATGPRRTPGWSRPRTAGR